MEDPLKKIYKKAFDTYTQPVDPFEFDKLQLVLNKYNFMRFDVFQFNVYYASMIASFFLLSIGTTSHYVYHFVMHKPEVEVAKTTTLVPKINVEQGTKLDKTTRIENKELKAKSESKASINVGNSSTKEKNTIFVDKEAITKQQSIENILSEPTYSEAQPFAEPTKIHVKKQKVVIELQDTIHKFDTIKTKSSFWQRKK